MIYATVTYDIIFSLICNLNTFLILQVVKKDTLVPTVIRVVSVKMVLFVISLLEHVRVKMDILVLLVLSHVLLGGMVQTVVWHATVRIKDHVTREQDNAYVRQVTMATNVKIVSVLIIIILFYLDLFFKRSKSKLFKICSPNLTAIIKI